MWFTKPVHFTQRLLKWWVEVSLVKEVVAIDAGTPAKPGLPHAIYTCIVLLVQRFLFLPFSVHLQRLFSELCTSPESATFLLQCTEN